MFQVSQAASRHPMLQLKPQNQNDLSSKFASSTPYFGNTASELAHVQISVDLFIFTTGKNQFRNVQTFSDLARKSSGNLYFYSEFDVYQHAMKFTNELYTCLTRQHAWEAVFRIRTSAGFNQISTLGNILIKQKTSDLIICPTIDKDRVICY